MLRTWDWRRGPRRPPSNPIQEPKCRAGARRLIAHAPHLAVVVGLPAGIRTDGRGSLAGFVSYGEIPYSFRMPRRKPKPRSYRFEIRLSAGMYTRLQAAVTATGLRQTAIAHTALDEWLARREQPPLPFVNERPSVAQTEGDARPLSGPSEAA